MKKLKTQQEGKLTAKKKEKKKSGNRCLADLRSSRIEDWCSQKAKNKTQGKL